MGRRSSQLLSTERPADGAGVVARAFDVLRCFDGFDASLSNGEIAARSGLPRSTVSRLAATLTRIGQLSYSANQQRYRLGPAALAMSTAMIAELRLRPALDQLLRAFTAETPGTVGLLLPVDFHMVYLAHARGFEPEGARVKTGDRVPMGRTAGGHAHVARLPLGEAQALVGAMEATYPAEAALLRDAAQSDRACLTMRGYVVSCGLWSPHINGCAVPLRSALDGPPYVLTVGVRSAEFDEARVHREIGPRMLALARDVEPLRDAAALRDATGQTDLTAQMTESSE